MFNGTGGYTGVSISTTGGKADVSEYSGVIEVLADCTAVGKTGTGAGATDFDLVVVDAGNSFALVIRAGDATLSGSGSKIDNQGSCSNSPSMAPTDTRATAPWRLTARAALPPKSGLSPSMAAAE